MSNTDKAVAEIMAAVDKYAPEYHGKREWVQAVMQSERASLMFAIRAAIAQPAADVMLLRKRLDYMIKKYEPLNRDICTGCMHWVKDECRHSHGPLVPSNGVCGGKYAITQPASQTQAEPVAWINPGMLHTLREEGGWAHAHGAVVDGLYTTPLYTHPAPAAQAIDVTDADVNKACFHIDGDYYENSGTSKMRMRRALEAFAASKAGQTVEPVDSMGIPLSCGKPLCSPGDHHQLCRLHAQQASQTVEPAPVAQPAVSDAPAPLQGLASYLRCEAENGLFRGSEAHTMFLSWASEVDAASRALPATVSPELALQAVPDKFLCEIRDLAWREGAAKTVRAIDAVIGTPQERRAVAAPQGAPAQAQGINK